MSDGYYLNKKEFSKAQGFFEEIMPIFLARIIKHFFTKCHALPAWECYFMSSSKWCRQIFFLQGQIYHQVERKSLIIIVVLNMDFIQQSVKVAKWDDNDMIWPTYIELQDQPRPALNAQIIRDRMESLFWLLNYVFFRILEINFLWKSYKTFVINIIFAIS